MCPNTFMFPCFLKYYHLIYHPYCHISVREALEKQYIGFERRFLTVFVNYCFCHPKQLQSLRKCTAQWASTAFHLFLILFPIPFCLPLFWLAWWSMNGQPPKIPSSNMFKLVSPFCIFGRYLKAVWNPSHTPCVIAD